MAYNPFDKPIGDTLEESDLERLFNVAEGYFVEYKSILLKPLQIAQTIASLANTDGGWYFVGVDADKKTNVATALVGIDSINNDPISTVRDSLRAHISPIPTFYSQLIPLQNGKNILATFVPEEQETPFITSDGRIYRRVGDSSDPIKETDRYALDRLIDKGSQREKQFERFCEHDNTFYESESKSPWLKAYFQLIAPRKSSQEDLLEPDVVLNLFERMKQPRPFHFPSDIGGGTIQGSFNVLRMSTNSITFEMIDMESLESNPLTLELFHNGSARFLIPIPYFNYDFRTPAQNPERLIRTWLEVVGAKSSQTFQFLKFVQMDRLIQIVIFLAGFYQSWLSESGSASSVRYGFVLDGIWRCVPFFDSEIWTEHVKRFGFPVARKNQITFPRQIGKGKIFEPRTEWELWFDLLIFITYDLGIFADTGIRAMLADAISRNSKIE